MKIVEIFQDGETQVVRLPKQFNFDDDKVFVNKIGNSVVLLPYHDPWGPLLDSLDKFSDDFMEDREQPEEQTRINLFK